MIQSHLLRRKPIGLGMWADLRKLLGMVKNSHSWVCTIMYIVLFCTFLLYLILDYATITSERNMKGVYYIYGKNIQKNFSTQSAYEYIA